MAANALNSASEAPWRAWMAMDSQIQPDSASERESRLEFHLRNWARWMRSGGMAKSLPGHSVGFVSGNSQTFEDICEDVDLASAIKMDALIRGLSPVEQCAILNVYLDAVWQFNRELPEVVLARAEAELQRGMDRRGIY